MSHLRVVVYRVEDAGGAPTVTELQRVDLAPADLDQLVPETTLDVVEDQAIEVGTRVMRAIIEGQWQEIDHQAVARAARLSPPDPLDS